MNDPSNAYTYDAEGNVTQVVNTGGTSKYVYDALNHRVHVQTPSTTVDYIFDYAGRRISTWTSPTFATEAKIFWDGQQLGFRAYDGTTYFDHQDVLGTERLRSNYSGGVAATYSTLPWGDGYTAVVNNTWGDQDNGHFCVTGGVSAVLDGLPQSVLVGAITGGISYWMDSSAANAALNQDLQACNQIL